MPNLLHMSMLDVYRLLHDAHPYAYDADWYDGIVRYEPWPWSIMARHAVALRLGRLG